MHRQRAFSEHTMEVIDEEVSKILHRAAESAEKLLTDHRADLEKLTRALLESEELSEQEIRELIGPSVHE